MFININYKHILYHINKKGCGVFCAASPHKKHRFPPFNEKIPYS